MDELADVVNRAVRWHRFAVVRREAAPEIHGRPIPDRAGLEARFASALETLWMAKQPIVSCGQRSGIRGLRDRVERLRTLGFRIAIDDLGAGYAGRSSCAALEPDVVKADMSLVRGIETSPTRQKLMRAIVALSNDLGVQLIAEGVETAGEHHYVAALGAHAVQGYFFARPGRGFPPITT